MAKGKLIVFEAGDGSGKETQVMKVYDRLKDLGYPVHHISYPDYNSESSALVRMYLRGDFGSKATDVNAYAAASFYAVDRYASYATKWKKWYEAGDIILADRYIDSNTVHQSVKIEDEKKQDDFIVWTWDLEYVKFGLPLPDCTIFLDMPSDIAASLIEKRARSERMDEDIHELDKEYLRKVHDAYADFAARYGWKVVTCGGEGNPRTIEDIHEDVFSIVRRIVEQK